MKNNKLIGFFSMLCGVVGCTANGFQSMSVEEFGQAIADKEVVVLDVRTFEEYAKGHLPGAVLLDMQQPDFRVKASSRLPKACTVAVYCRTGNRSKMAARMLAEEGFRVIELDKGYQEWVKARKDVTNEEVDTFVTAEGLRVSFHCIKHGSLRIQVGTQWIYIDPVGEAAQPVTDYSAFPKADAILVTHEHYDHLDKQAIDQLLMPGTQVITNPRSNEQLGGQCQALCNGEKTLLFGKYMLEAVPAYNYSADKLAFHPKGRDNGYILTVDNLRIYVAGDTEDIPELSDVHDIDIAFLPCNLPYTMTPQQFAQAARKINPKVVFPYHYGQTDIQSVLPLLEGTGIEVRIRSYQ